MPNAISFDFWNTLYADGAEDQRRSIRKEYFQEIINNYGDYGPADVEHAFKAGSELFLTNWINHSKTPTTSKRIDYMARSIGIRLKEEDIQKASEFFGLMIFEIQPREIPFVKELIPKLSNKYPLGIISDTGFISGKYIRDFLQSKNLLDYFSSLIFSDEQKHSKPHPSVFLKTCENLGSTPKDLIHIGDLERTDVAGAVDLGCISVKFTGVQHDQPQKSRAQYIILDYQQLSEIVKW
jgi:putative hydrolase of the HAD superfamily